MVDAEGVDGRLYFRFYDPRVLSSVLPAFTAEQRTGFFGPIHCFVHEGAAADIQWGVRCHEDQPR